MESLEAAKIAKEFLVGKYIGHAISSVNGRPFSRDIQDIGIPAGTSGAVLNTAARKRGRTTSLTYGFVDSMNGTVKLDYGDGIGERTLQNQIGVRPDSARNPKFSDHGDSGSVRVDDSNNIIALLFSGSTDDYTFGNPIEDVLKKTQY